MHTCTCVTENPVGGKNRKIGEGDKVSFDTSAGPPSVGGTCIAVTGGCKYCYATAQQKVMASFGGKATANATLAFVNPEKYADLAISEIKGELVRRSRQRKHRHVPALKLIRIHGFGDFFSTRHLAAWLRIVRAFPHIKFFGTTRTWRLAMGHGETWLHPSKPGFVPDRRAFVAMLDTLRSEPNVFLGASIDESTRDTYAAPHLTHGRKVNVVEWLRSNGWNIWNALTDFGDKAERERVGGVPVVRFDPHSKEREKALDAQRAAREQGEIAARTDPPKLLGPICYEQTGERKNCSTCMYCAQRGIMVTFAYHIGHAKKATPARGRAFDSGYLKSMSEYGLDVPVGPDGATVLIEPLSKQTLEAQTNLFPVTEDEGTRQVAENPSREFDLQVAPGFSGGHIAPHVGHACRIVGLAAPDSVGNDNRVVDCACGDQFVIPVTSLRKISSLASTFRGDESRMRLCPNCGVVAPVSKSGTTLLRHSTSFGAICDGREDNLGPDGRVPRSNPAMSFREGDVVQATIDDTYSGIRTGALGVVVGFGSGSAYADPSKHLVAVYWQGGHSEGFPRGGLRKLGHITAKPHGLPRYSTAAQERAAVVHSLRDQFEEWLQRAKPDAMNPADQEVLRLVTSRGTTELVAYRHPAGGYHWTGPGSAGSGDLELLLHAAAVARIDRPSAKASGELAKKFWEAIATRPNWPFNAADPLKASDIVSNPDEFPIEAMGKRRARRPITKAELGEKLLRLESADADLNKIAKRLTSSGFRMTNENIGLLGYAVMAIRSEVGIGMARLVPEHMWDALKATPSSELHLALPKDALAHAVLCYELMARVKALVQPHRRNPPGDPCPCRDQGPCLFGSDGVCACGRKRPAPGTEECKGCGRWAYVARGSKLCDRCISIEHPRTRENPSLILVTGNPPASAAEVEAAWCEFHQKSEYDGVTKDLGKIAGAPPITFALGHCKDIDFGRGPQSFRPRPWLVYNPVDKSLWIVSEEPMRLGNGIAGKTVCAITYDPPKESGKDPAYYRHKFDKPCPVLSPVGNPNYCRAILLDGGVYEVSDWIRS